MGATLMSLTVDREGRQGRSFRGETGSRNLHVVLLGAHRRGTSFKKKTAEQRKSASPGVQQIKRRGTKRKEGLRTS